MQTLAVSDLAGIGHLAASMAIGQFLHQSVVMEPLVANWYAWALLLAPGTFGLIAKNHQFALMDSFLEAPEVHWQASNIPKMRGGPFIGIPPDQIEDVRRLRARMGNALKPQLELGEAIQEVWALLRDRAQGDALGDVYRQLPSVLRGCVELTYDAAGQAQPRLIEPLLYEAARSWDQHQAIRLYRQGLTRRPFALNTPRIPSADDVIVRVPFASPAIDRIAKARLRPDSASDIADELCLLDQQRTLFCELFVDDPPPASAPVFGPGVVQVTHLNHATVLLQSSRCSILLDPLIGHPVETGRESVCPSYSELPDHIDVIALTHNHQDHIALETLLELRHKAGLVIAPRNAVGNPIDPSVPLILRSSGFSAVRAIEEFETINVPGGRIVSLPFFGEHGDLNIQSKTSYFVELDGKTFLFLADSNNLDGSLYQRLPEFVREPDIAFIGLECEGAPLSWLYGPLLPFGIKRQHDQARRLNGSNAERAVAICDVLRPRQVVVYAMGQEEWLGHLLATDYTSESVPIKEAHKFIGLMRRRNVPVHFPCGRQRWIVAVDRASTVIQSDGR